MTIAPHTHKLAGLPAPTSPAQLLARLALVRACWAIVLGLLTPLMSMPAAAAWQMGLVLLGVLAPLNLFSWWSWEHGPPNRPTLIVVEAAVLTLGLGTASPGGWLIVTAAAILLVPTAALCSESFSRTATTVVLLVGVSVSGLATSQNLVLVIAVVGAFAGIAVLLNELVESGYNRVHDALLLADEFQQGIPGCIWEADAVTGEFTFLAGDVENVLGFSKAQAAADPRAGLNAMHPDDSERVTIRLRQARKMKDPVVREYRMIDDEGSIRHIRDTVRAVTRSDGSIALRGLAIDVTDSAERELELAQLADVIRHTDDIVLVFNQRSKTPTNRHASPRHEMTLANCNARAEEVFGEKCNIGERVLTLLDNVGLLNEVRELSGADSVGRTTVSDPMLGALVLDLHAHALPGDSVALIATDRTDESRAVNSLRHSVHHDELTGMGNRRLLIETMADREANGLAFGLLMLDLDRFKEINDTLGHVEGDRVLQEVGNRLTAAVRPDDLVVRLGGDEFAILTPCTGPPREGSRSRLELAYRVSGAVTAPMQLAGLSVTCGVSIGVSEPAPSDTTPMDLLHRADVAMYAAKQQGVEVVSYDPDLERGANYRLALQHQLPGAASKGELLMHWQPQVELATGSLVSVEGLIRWYHPEQGIISPQDFIDLAEMTGDIAEITDLALQQSIHQLMLGRVPAASINVSARELFDTSLVSSLASHLERSSIDPSRLTLELTERAVLGRHPQFNTTLAQLADLGVRLSIDDVGTSPTSLDRLVRLNVNELKIDRSFIASAEADPHSAVLVGALVDVGRQLGLTVVAEGIANESTRQLLLDWGCHRGQGYLFSKPVPSDALPTLDRQY